MTSSSAITSPEDFLAQILADAASKLARIVIDPPGSTPNSRTFRKARAAQLLAQIDKLNRQLKLGISSTITSVLSPAYREGLAEGLRQLRAAGIIDGNGDLGRTGSFALVDQHGLAVIARDTYQDLAKAVDGMTARATKLLRRTAEIGLSNQDLNRIIAPGLLTGDIQAVGRELRDELRALHGKTIPIIDKNGDTINFKTSHYADLVARTRTAEAQNQGALARYVQMNVKLVMITGRISKNFCTGYLGHVFSIAGDDPTYPPLSSLPSGGPPFHPRCSKGYAPFSVRLATPTQLKGSVPTAHLHALLQTKDTSELQRIFVRLGGQATAKGRYATTADKLYAGTKS